ncbi:major allergen Equ c 1-like isoform X2 [Bos javanicus]|uniref:major allergen Equ c 1-like isoform X2 n=1 Tax=Bos javanicus TaxID=9906 RepID=UPI002AA7FF3B|nr:major allergen Equ c 1-like isoform X2 [Bos javanicus]
MKLLLLCLGLTLVCAQEGNSDVVRSNFDIPEIAGEWYSILLASDNREKIEENGSMRVFVEYIDVLENSSLSFKFHTKVNGVCTELSLVSDSTGEDGVYTVSSREPDTSPELKNEFVEICQKYGVVKENIIDLTKVDRCLQERGNGVA